MTPDEALAEARECIRASSGLGDHRWLKVGAASAPEDTGISLGTLRVLTERAARLPGELAGVQEAAEIGGISRQQVLNLRRQPGFPEPFQELACGTLWLAAELREYFAIPRPPGRPRAAAR